MPHSYTDTVDVLGFISCGWEKAITIANVLRQLNIEAPTQARTMSDTRLLLEPQIFLNELRSKIRVSFDLNIHVAKTKNKGSPIAVSMKPYATAVYGTQFDEASMTGYLDNCTRSENKEWSVVIRNFRQKLKGGYFHRR